MTLYTWTTKVEEADWMAPRLLDWKPMRVGSTVPVGFPAYCRIFHPAYGKDHHRVRWQDIARWAGTPLAPMARYEYLALPQRAPKEPFPAEGGDPLVGEMDPGDFEALAGLLRQSEGDADTWFAVWDGFGWMPESKTLTGEMKRGPVDNVVPNAVWHAPRVRLPARDYFLLQGTVDGAVSFSKVSWGTPNLWWNRGPGWCLATEIDFCWTYLGGSLELIDRVCQSSDLEAYPVTAQDEYEEMPQWLDDYLESLVDEFLAHKHCVVSTSRGNAKVSLSWSLAGPTMQWRTDTMASGGMVIPGVSSQFRRAIYGVLSGVIGQIAGYAG